MISGRTAMTDVTATPATFRAGFDPFATQAGLVRDRLQPVRDAARGKDVARSIAALASHYPVINRLLGDSFRTVAYQYALKEPLGSFASRGYGATFPGFLRGLRRGVSTDYLADIAQLEQACAACQNADTARPLNASAFTRLSPQQLNRSRARLHPTLHLIQSRFPVVTIWQSNRYGDGAVNGWGAEEALVARPFRDVEVRRLPPGGIAYVRALANHGTFSDAVEAGQREFSDFDAVANHALLMEANVVVELQAGKRHCGNDLAIKTRKG
jgi:hypothetical protein